MMVVMTMMMISLNISWHFDIFRWIWASAPTGVKRANRGSFLRWLRQRSWCGVLVIGVAQGVARREICGQGAGVEGSPRVGFILPPDQCGHTWRSYGRRWFEVVSYVRAVFDNPYYSTKTPSSSVLMEVSHEAVAWRPIAQPYRHFVRVGSLSLWHGTNFEIACVTLSALWACRIALVVAVRRAFW